MNLPLRLIVCLLAAALMAPAFQQKAPPARPGAARTRTVAKPPGDRELEAAIRARFARSKISVNNFQVRVQGGVATIEGRANVIQHKGTATRLARLAGAKEVVNRIQVSEEARAKASENLAKGRRRAQVKRGEARSEVERNR